MDALWKLEDKLKLSTPKAATLLVCSVVLVIGACIAIFRVRRKGRNRVVAEDENESDFEVDCSSCDRELLVKDVLSESVRWSKARRWEGFAERRRCWTRWCSRDNRVRAPVWQRPILMGEKCELPTFSGLILYDQNGHPLSGSP